MKHRKIISILLSLLLVTTPLMARNHKDIENIGNRQINGRVFRIFPNFTSLESEARMGAEYAAFIENNAPIENDPELNEYITALTNKIVKYSDAKQPIKVKIIRDDTINAFALPGGYLYVHTGLIEAVESEAELAGVLAHEISHVIARHSTEMATKGQLIQYSTIPLMFVLGGSWKEYLLYQGIGFGLSMLVLGISRGAEIEADQLGAQYLWNAGYDPMAFVDFFKRLEEEKGNHIGFFSTHPPFDDRARKVIEEIAFFPVKDERQLTSGAFTDMQQILADWREAENSVVSDNPDRPTLRRKRNGKIEKTEPEPLETEETTDEN
jgi:predicted Zn-dependent protease